MTDQYRWDYTGYSGMGKMATPNIDRIAGSAAFSLCQTANPVCTPARCALLAGRYTRQIHMQSMSGDLSHAIRTFPQALQSAGYHTMASGKMHLVQPWGWGDYPLHPEKHIMDLVALKPEIMKYGFHRLWESSGKQIVDHNRCDYAVHLENKGLYKQYIEAAKAARVNYWKADSPDNEGFAAVVPDEDYIDVVTCDNMIEFLEERPKDKPFFGFCSFCSPHKPFDPPQSYLDRVPYEEIDDFLPGPDGQVMTEEEKKAMYRRRRHYKAMILLLDDQVGRLFDYLETNNLLENTAVMFTADHGEMMGDHFQVQKMSPFKASSTIPLAIRHPDHLNAVVNNSPVELTDLTATVLDIAGLDPHKALSFSWPRYNDKIPGLSLMPVIRGEADRVREFSYTEYYSGGWPYGDWQMLQTEDMKYIKTISTPSPDVIVEQLYDLTNDPDELVNVADNPEYHDRLEWFRRRRAYLQDQTPPVQTKWAPVLY